MFTPQLIDAMNSSLTGAPAEKSVAGWKIHPFGSVICVLNFCKCQDFAMDYQRLVCVFFFYVQYRAIQFWNRLE